MSTLADLIRAHERDPRGLYKPEVSERVSAPGHYKDTASQRSPALDRRLERDAARETFDKLKDPRGLDPDDRDKIDDFEDLNDILQGRDPDLRDPEIPDPEVPELPDPEDPDTPDLPLEPPFVVDGLSAYALHPGAISLSDTGGATWTHYPGAPSAPIGFSVLDGGFYVATSSSVSYSDDLRTWRELPILGDRNLPISGFSNGGFEGGLGSWDVISMLSPTTGFVDHVLPSEGVSYLRRNWIAFTDGEFEIAQEVVLTPAEMAAVADGGALSFSGDVFGDGGTAELRIERNVTGLPYFRATDRLLGDGQDSDLLSLISMIGSEDLPDNVTGAKILFNHLVSFGGGDYNVGLTFSIFLRIDNQWQEWTHDRVNQSDVSASQAIIRSGKFRRDYSLTLTHPTLPGTINLGVPNDWRHNVDFWAAGPQGNWSQTFGFLDSSAFTIGWGNGWITMASANRSEFTWGRIAAEVGPVPTDELRCVIKVTGSPAEAYVDNCRFEVVRDPEAMAVTAIGGGRVAVNGSIYRMSPEGLEFERALEFDPTGIASDGSIVWGGDSIFIAGEEQTYSLSHGITEAFSDPAGAIVLMSSGEVWQRRNDPEFPGWDTLSSDRSIVDMVQVGGAWFSVTDDGSIAVTQDFSSWTPTPDADIEGELSLAAIGQTLVVYTKGQSWFCWLKNKGWNFGGSLRLPILDFSA